MSNIDFDVVNKICKTCGQTMVKFSGGYKCIICGTEYTNKQIQTEIDKLKKREMR
jgi:tRNA(Ile2) C34 agmatinyltransferase TiaS